MQEVILLKYGEIILKGLNRAAFEIILMKNLKRKLKGLGACSISKAQSTVYIVPKADDFDIDEAIAQLKKLFGFIAISRACVVKKDMNEIRKAAVSYLEEALKNAHSFKVEAKRADKAFEYNSPQICCDVGEIICDNYSNLRVDVHNPEITVRVEIRDFGAYIHAGAIAGAGGMPVGSNGRAGLLISGGIDSPVAGYMIAKRGVKLVAIHFASPPYTSELARQKVLDLLKIVSLYSTRIITYIVPFTAIQEQIRRNCPEDLFTIIMRRIMMRCAQIIAQNERCTALVTGESIGQVASQTLEALVCTDEVTDMPVFRPLIGMDKSEIIITARKIGTFETSLEPYQDCCTVFTPKHPRTRPKLTEVKEAESSFDFSELINTAVFSAEKIVIDP